MLDNSKFLSNKMSNKIKNQRNLKKLQENNESPKLLKNNIKKPQLIFL